MNILLNNERLRNQALFLYFIVFYLTHVGPQIRVLSMSIYPDHIFSDNTLFYQSLSISASIFPEMKSQKEMNWNTCLLYRGKEVDSIVFALFYCRTLKPSIRKSWKQLRKKGKYQTLSFLPKHCMALRTLFSTFHTFFNKTNSNLAFKLL